MASLKEIKGRIASVSGTLKITSAMKLVASAKLRKAQLAITNMLPYQRQLQLILSRLMAEGAEEHAAGDASVPRPYSAAAEREWTRPGTGGATATSVAIVAFSSNSSLCGAFNSNAIRQTLSVIDEYRSAGFTDENIIVYSVGRKIAEAMRKAGFQSPEDYSKMAESPGYEAASALAKELIEGHLSERSSWSITTSNPHLPNLLSGKPTCPPPILPASKPLTIRANRDSHRRLPLKPLVTTSS